MVLLLVYVEFGDVGHLFLSSGDILS